MTVGGSIPLCSLTANMCTNTGLTHNTKQPSQIGGSPVRPTDAFDSDSDVCVGLPCHTCRPLINKVRLSMGLVAEWDWVQGDECAEQLFRSLDKFRVVDPTSANEKHVIGGIVVLEIHNN